MSEKTLTFGDIVLNKNELQVSKKPSALNLVGIDETVVSDQYINTVTKVATILLAIWMVMSLKLYALFYLK